MKRKGRRPKVTALKTVRRKVSGSRTTLPVKASSPINDVVWARRPGRFVGCDELPDKVLRSIASKALNPRLAIRANHGVWKAWCAAQKKPVRSYPSAPAAVAALLQAQAPPIRVTRGGDFEDLKTGVTSSGKPAKSLATLSRYLGTLRKLNGDGGYPDPTKDPEVLAVWRELRRGLDRSAQKAPLTFEDIRHALVSLPENLAGKRDRALLLLAYTLMTRRSELVALNVEDFQSHDDGSASATIERLKTGEQWTNDLSPEVMAILRDGLAAAHID